MHTEEIQRRRQRCERFISLERVDRSLLGTMWEPAVRPIKGYLDFSRPLDSDDISSAEMCSASDETVHMAEAIRQDCFYATQACFGHQ